MIKDSMFVKAEVAANEKEHIAAPASSMIADAWARLRKNKAAVVSLGILIVIILLAIFAPVFSKYDFAFTDYSNVYSTSTKEHIFGCDQFGRDLWTRVWMGTRISLMIALVAAVLDLVVGVLYGAVSALLGGRVDALMQRIIEILVGIPSLIIVILFLMAFPAGVGTIIAALSITGWVNMARLVRAEILKLKNQEFVMASHVLGSNNFYIIMKDLIKLMEPKYIEVWGKFTPRGGLSIDPYANYGKPGTEWEEVAKKRMHFHDMNPEIVNYRK